MEYKNLKDEPIEAFVNNVQQLAAVASQAQVQSVAALLARLTIETAGSLENVWAGLHDVKKALVESSGRLERTLADASGRVEKAVIDASDGSSKQTAALVRWTKVLVVATIVYTLITGGLLIATILKNP